MEERQAIVQQIREFNRFYTVLLGFLNRDYLDSGYSITETRILFELKQGHPLSANRLIEMLHLDKGYVSRLIRGFEQKGLVTRHTSPEDRRALIIRLTPRGEQEADRLIERTNQTLSELIRPLSGEACARLCQAMGAIMDSFPNHSSVQEKDYGM